MVCLAQQRTGSYYIQWFLIHQDGCEGDRSFQRKKFVVSPQPQKRGEIGKNPEKLIAHAAGTQKAQLVG